MTEGGLVGSGPDGDRIELRGIRVMGVHGVLASERQQPQPFVVDLDVWVDLDQAGRSDELADTVDYAGLATVAAAVVRDRSFFLLEALADTIASGLLAVDARVEAVAVRVRKVRPPVSVDATSVGVRLLRRRSAP
jgi:dihydroneopterin aldolase